MGCNLPIKKKITAFCRQKATSSSRSTIREVQCYFLSQPITVKETGGCLFYIFLFAKKLGSIIHSAKGWCTDAGVVSVTSYKTNKSHRCWICEATGSKVWKWEQNEDLALHIPLRCLTQAVCSRNHEASRTAQLSPPSRKLLVSVCVSNITIWELLLS